MKFATLFTAALFTAGTTLAAPVAEPNTVDMMADGAKWAFQNFKRVCNDADTSCKYTYSINTRDNTAIPKCAYTITGAHASRKSYDNIKCGAFTISSGWSGQFGPGNGYSTLAVKRGNKLTHPSYTDKELQDGKVVRPNKAYTPETITV